MTLLQHHVLALALTALTTFGLGLLVFLAEPKRRLNQIFGLYSLSIAWWAATEACLYGIAPSISFTRTVAFIEWIGVIFIAPTFLHSVILLTGGPKEKTEKRTLSIGYVLGAILLLFHLFIPNSIALPPRPVSYCPRANGLTILGMGIPILFAVLVNYALWKLYRAYRCSSGQRRTQLKFLLFSSTIGYLGGTPDWFLTFGFQVPYLNPFGIYFVPLYSIATTYAVLHHKLFNINLVIRKSLVYSLLVTTLTVSYFGLVYIIEQAFQTTLGYKSFWISLGAFAMMALLFQPLKVGTQRLVDWLIFRAPQHELVRRLENLEREARKTEKLKAVTTLAAGLCHELRNPLQTIRTHAEFLPERYDDPVFRKRCAEVMRTEIGRIDEFLKQLMEFAKPKAPAFRLVEPHQILDSTLDLLSNEFVKRQIQLDRQYRANGARLHGDPEQLRQVILNLIVNALEAIGQKGKILVKTSQENGWFTLEVADTGPGIDPKILPKLFEPFTTTKPDGNGLGLSIVHDIIREHRGNISAQSHPGQNTIFTITLPIS